MIYKSNISDSDNLDEFEIINRQYNNHSALSIAMNRKI